MTEELLSEAVGKINDVCGDIIFRPDEYNPGEWCISKVMPYTAKTSYPLWERYSPTLTLCQLVDWCEAWLQGAEEIKAVFAKATSEKPRDDHRRLCQAAERRSRGM